MTNYSERIFNNYAKDHTCFLDTNHIEKIKWFKKYYHKYFFSYINSYPHSASILEIGCNKGYLLKTLHDEGFTNLTGIDLSPDDLNHAISMNLGLNLKCIDAKTFLNHNKNTFKIIIMKAVLEHVKKEEIFPLMQLIYESLQDSGIVIIDVPNMDWLFASHERYMDFTHEVGFTKESIRQLLKSFFSEFEVQTCDNNLDFRLHKKILAKITRFILNQLLKFADPEGASNPIWEKTLIGIGYKK